MEGLHRGAYALGRIITIMLDEFLEISFATRYTVVRLLVVRNPTRRRLVIGCVHAEEATLSTPMAFAGKDLFEGECIRQDAADICEDVHCGADVLQCSDHPRPSKVMCWLEELIHHSGGQPSYAIFNKAC